MENKNGLYNYVDSGNVQHSVQIDKSDFELVQVDKSIHDTKFKSKPTTFFKDALKRFSKNKASVAGAIILGILLLSSFIVPIADTNDIYTSRGNENFLPPKLFPYGTGFWDGSKDYSNIAADPATLNEETGKMYPGSYTSAGTTIEFNPDYITNLSKPKAKITHSPSKFGEGGTFVFSGKKITNNMSGEISDEEFQQQLVFKYYSPIANMQLLPTVNKEGEVTEKAKDYTITVDVKDDFDYNVIKAAPTKYRLSLAYGPKVDDKKGTFLRKKENIPLTEFVTGDLTLNVNSVIDALPEESKPTVEELKTASIVVEGLPLYEGPSAIAFNKIEVKETKYNEAGDPEEPVLLPNISITEPVKDLAASYKEEDIYWNLYTPGDIGSVGVRDASVYVVSFTYDAYGAIYGLNPGKEYGENELYKYVSKGKLPSDIFSDEAVESGKYLNKDLFKVEFGGKIYDDTPIRYFTEYIEHDIFNPETEEFEPFYTVVCETQRYKEMGYKSEPIFIFGTDRQGHDIFKKAFVGLRSSLLLGLGAAAVCFLFGLCWGAVEGYFGGNVDIIMQRFTDILSGVPWIVIMTLMIIKFGNTPGVFIAALCLTGWIGVSGLTRTQFYRFRGREYILASRTLGASDTRLIFRHILPNAMGTIITSSVLMIPSIVFQEATISYLGLGLKGQRFISLGVTLSNNQQYLQTYPNLLIVPAVIIALLMISFNLFGNGLRDAFNPSLKGSE